ncbi:MAG TPA: hypothetical protein VJ831_02955, partial [Jatrophihabitantaceae bacterium]|nr:hypothetical protein [Jatrophihabitantaceae bacterium]
MAAAVVAAATMLPAATASARGVVPIPEGVALVPSYVGAPATANPIDAPPVPQHPFMAPNGDSGIHDDGWQTNSYTRPGPLGRDPKTIS